MTVYAILPPPDKGHAYVTPWKSSKREAWENLKFRTGKTKRVLKEEGYRMDEHTDDDPLSSGEQMMLMGR